MKEKAREGILTTIDPLENEKGHLKIIENILKTGGVKPASPNDDIIMINASDKAISQLNKQIKKH
jgi:hypothetical protein